MAEQLALREFIQRAEVALEVDNKDSDFADFWELSFPDTDILMLFDPVWDGIEDSEIGDYLGTRGLSPNRWFDPLYEDVPVHSYVVEDH